MGSRACGRMRADGTELDAGRSNPTSPCPRSPARSGSPTRRRLQLLGPVRRRRPRAGDPRNSGGRRRRTGNRRWSTCSRTPGRGEHLGAPDAWRRRGPGPPPTSFAFTAATRKAFAERPRRQARAHREQRVGTGLGGDAIAVVKTLAQIVVKSEVSACRGYLASRPLRVLMPSTPFASPQVVWRCFACFRVVKFSIPAGQRAFCSGFDSRQLHQWRRDACV